MVYLFIGEDSVAKDLKLKALKQEILDKNTEPFNLDTVYAKELTLKELQEKLIYLPLRNSRRVLIIKDAQNLKEEIKDFLLRYVKKPSQQIVLVLDAYSQGKPQDFLNRISGYAKTCRFQEARKPDAFALSRCIELKKADYALRLLNELLKNGERPERILGGLRYVWEKGSSSSLDASRKLRLLLNCDIDIKTGKLKPVFALEKLVVALCSAAPSRN